MMEFLVGTVGTVGGVAVAIALFGLAYWGVARARASNREVREARHDPHMDMRENRDDTVDPHRDFPQ